MLVWLILGDAWWDGSLLYVAKKRRSVGCGLGESKKNERHWVPRRL